MMDIIINENIRVSSFSNLETFAEAVSVIGIDNVQFICCGIVTDLEVTDALKLWKIYNEWNKYEEKDQAIILHFFRAHWYDIWYDIWEFEYMTDAHDSFFGIYQSMEDATIGYLNALIPESDKETELYEYIVNNECVLETIADCALVHDMEYYYLID